MKYQFIVTVEYASRKRREGGCNYTARVYRLDSRDPYGFTWVGEMTSNTNGPHGGVWHTGWQVVIETNQLPRRILKQMDIAMAADPVLPNLRRYYQPSLMQKLGVFLQEIR